MQPGYSRRGALRQLLARADGARACVVAGMDSVRNMTTSPISGIDPHEILDCRQLSTGWIQIPSWDTDSFPEVPRLAA